MAGLTNWGGGESRKLSASRLKSVIETEVLPLPFAAPKNSLAQFIFILKCQSSKTQLCDRVPVVVQAPGTLTSTTQDGAASAVAREG
jgi:hypothetical protein